MEVVVLYDVEGCRRFLSMGAGGCRQLKGRLQSPSVTRFSSRESGGVAYPLGSVFSRLSASVDISVVNIHSKLHGTVDLCLLSLLTLRSHFLFQATSCIGYMHASVYLLLSLFLCSHSRDSRISRCWRRR